MSWHMNTHETAASSHVYQLYMRLEALECYDLWYADMTFYSQKNESTNRTSTRTTNRIPHLELFFISLSILLLLLRQSLSYGRSYILNRQSSLPPLRRFLPCIEVRLTSS